MIFGGGAEDTRRQRSVAPSRGLCTGPALNENRREAVSQSMYATERSMLIMWFFVGLANAAMCGLNFAIAFQLPIISVIVAALSGWAALWVLMIGGRAR